MAKKYHGLDQMLPKVSFDVAALFNLYLLFFFMACCVIDDSILGII